MDMIRKMVALGVLLLLVDPLTVSAAPSQALCQQIYEQTAVRAAGCPDMAAVVAKAAPKDVVSDAVRREQRLPAPSAKVVPPAARVSVSSVPVSSTSVPSQLSGYLTDRQRESHVFFPAGGHVLDAAAMAQLARIAKILQTPAMEGACVRLVGHSDSVGRAVANQNLSLARANGVAEHLRGLLADPKRVQDVLGMGEKEPLPGVDPAARDNRRVAIWARSCVVSTALR